MFLSVFWTIWYLKCWGSQFKQGCHFTWKNMKKPWILEILKKPGILNTNFKKPGKTWSFYQILHIKQEHLDLKQKIYYLDKIFCHHQKTFILKNIIKIALKYLFNIFIPFNILFNLRHNFQLKIEKHGKCFWKNKTLW